MKSILAFLLLAIVCSQTPNSNPTIKSFNPIDFAFNLYISSNLIYHIPGLTQCAIMDLPNLPTQIETFVAKVKEGYSTSNPQEIGDAILALAQSLDSNVVDCGNTLIDGKRVVEAALSDLKNITFLEAAVERIGANLPEVYNDALSLYDAVFNTPNATLAGTSLGDLLRIFFDIQKSYPLIESNLKPVSFLALALNAINWPFTNCGAGTDLLKVGQVQLDSTPSKGNPEGINIVGSMSDHALTKQVMITTSINGAVLNTQYDTFTKEFHKGDPVTYRFQITIPSFAPSGAYSVALTFQDANSKSYGCVNIAFNL